MAGRIPAADAILRVGYRPGAPTARGIAFDAMWEVVKLANPSALEVHYWIGTDVLNATRDAARARHRPAFERAKHALHFAGAPSLVEELRECGIRATYVPFPSSSIAASSALPLPERPAVLSYVPDARAEFYGGPVLLEVARRFPELPFHIVGGTGSWMRASPPANVTFHGWVSDMVGLYAQCSVVVRLVEHDAIGGTILEGMGLGRRCIYSCAFPHSRRVAFGSDADLEAALAEHLAAMRGGMGANLDGASFVRREFNEASLVERFVSELRGALTSKGRA